MTTPPREAVREEEGVSQSQPECAEAEPQHQPPSLLDPEALAKWLEPDAFDHRRRSPRNQQAAIRCRVYARKLAKKVLRWRPLASALRDSTASPAIAQSHRLDEPESSQNLLQARIKELEGELAAARASANHQRKQKQASNISRNRAADGVEYWKARAQKAEGELERMREALTKIANGGLGPFGNRPDSVARQALLPSEPEGEG